MIENSSKRNSIKNEAQKMEMRKKKIKIGKNKKE